MRISYLLVVPAATLAAAVVESSSYCGLDSISTVDQFVYEQNAEFPYGYVCDANEIQALPESSSSISEQCSDSSHPTLVFNKMDTVPRGFLCSNESIQPIPPVIGIGPAESDDLGLPSNTDIQERGIEVAENCAITTVTVHAPEITVTEVRHCGGRKYTRQLA